MILDSGLLFGGHTVCFTYYQYEWDCVKRSQEFSVLLIVSIWTEEDLRVDRAVRREGAHPLWPLSQRGSYPIKLAYGKPVCRQF